MVSSVKKNSHSFVFKILIPILMAIVTKTMKNSKEVTTENDLVRFLQIEG